MRKTKIFWCVALAALLSRGGFSQNAANSANKNANTKNEFSVWGNGDVFKCDPLLDGLLAGTGALIYATELGLQYGAKINQTQFDGRAMDKNDVNVVDRFFMQPYSKPLDITGTVFMAATIATPLIFFATEDKSDWLTIGIMYAETMLLAQGLKEMSKLFINRARPYMYFDDFPEKDVYDDLDWNNSAPSGHATLTFASASFFSYVFCKYNPHTAWRYPAVAGSYAVATAVAILRMASGNHFLTDVLFGAALGTGVGLLVPWLHTLTANKKNAPRISISPTSVSFSMRF